MGMSNQHSKRMSNENTASFVQRKQAWHSQARVRTQCALDAAFANAVLKELPV